MGTNNVTIESKVDGLWIKNGQLSAGPFQSLNDINPINVAPQIQVEPKQIFLAKMRKYPLQEHSKPIRRRCKDHPTFLPSVLATCFKRRFWDVGDCDDFGCQYLDWCILELRALSMGAVLLFYERAPTKCSICHRRKATHMFFVERGAHAPNSVFVTCSACVAKLPQHWKILKTEELPFDY